MIDENNPADNSGIEEDQAQAPEEGQTSAEQAADDTTDGPSEIELLEAENAELSDKLLRTIAEMENLRRRTERERKDASKYAITNFAQDLLAIGDNLARAMQTLDQTDEQQAQDMVKTLVDGIEMTEREMLNVFARHGIIKLDPKGEKFDPNLHQAIFEAPDPSIPSGMVMEVMQAGYKIGDRILRPAMVGVSKGGPKQAPVEDVADPEGQAPQSEEPAKQPSTASKAHEGPKDPVNLGKRVDKSA